jgi:hypothetical protein
MADAIPHQEVGMGILTAEDGVQPDHIPLPVQSLQIVRHGEQVHLGREFVGGMPPIAVGEDPQLSAPDELLQAFLDLGEIGRGIVGPGRDLLRDPGGALGVCLEGTYHVHPVERAGGRNGSRGRG